MNSTQTARCFFTACTAPVAYTADQKWNGTTVHTCEAHRPGAKALGLNGQPAPSGQSYENSFYKVTPCACS